MSNDNKENGPVVFEDEKKILLDHDYDGIRELNHPLPKWWLFTFWITIIFSVPYWAAHEFFGAQSIQEELVEDVKAAQDAKAEYDAKHGGFNLDEYNAYIATGDWQKPGKKTFKRKCKACHGKAGEGGVGPNLTDSYWLNGDGSEAAIYKVLKNGVPDKGMEAWADRLGKEKTFALIKIIKDFKGTNPEGAKEPQGQLYE